MPILGAVVHQQQDARARKALNQGIQQSLRLAVDPVQVLEYQHDRLIQALAEQEAPDSVQNGKTPAGALIFAEPGHVVQFAGSRVGDSKQREEGSQRVFQRSLQHQDLAPNFLAARARIVVIRDAEVTLEQIDRGQPRRGLAVRDREPLQRQAFGLCTCLELGDNARLADSGLADHRDDLPLTLLGKFERAAHLLHLALPPDELRVTAPCRALQTGPYRTEPRHFIHVDQLADALNPGRAERLELEVSFHELARLLTDCDRARRRDRLHPRR